MDAFYSQLLIVLLIISALLIFKFAYTTVLKLTENEGKTEMPSQNSHKPNNTLINPRTPMNERSLPKEDNDDD